MRPGPGFFFVLLSGVYVPVLRFGLFVFSIVSLLWGFFRDGFGQQRSTTFVGFVDIHVGYPRVGNCTIGTIFFDRDGGVFMGAFTCVLSPFDFVRAGVVGVGYLFVLWGRAIFCVLVGTGDVSRGVVVFVYHGGGEYFVVWGGVGGLAIAMLFNYNFGGVESSVNIGFYRLVWGLVGSFAILFRDPSSCRFRCSF